MFFVCCVLLVVRCSVFAACHVLFGCCILFAVVVCL